MSIGRETGGALYDEIGVAYGAARRTEPRIARRLWDALGAAESVLNVGAGTGSYEPPDRAVTAVEPSAVMRAQRPADAAYCSAAEAQALPLPDGSFERRAVAALRADLSNGVWQQRNRQLLQLEQADLGARLLVSG